MTNNTTSAGSSFTTLLQIAFIVLKLCDVINWSWWWVLSPLWITTGIVIIGFVILYIVEKNKKPVVPKSRWQQRMEEMQKKQKSESN